LVGGWRPGWPVRGSGVRGMLIFGANVTGFNVVNYFARHADNILIGKFLGAVPLGLYNKAYALLMLPINQIRGPLNSVGMPALSRLQTEPQRYKNYYLKMVQLIAFLSIPIVILLEENAHLIITLLLGPQWEGAVGIFKILAFAALIQPITGTVGLVMVSSGWSGRYFKIGAAASLVFVCSFVAGLHWGAKGVALSYTIANYLLLLPTLFYGFKGTAITIGDFGKAVSLPVLAGAGIILGKRMMLFVLNDPSGWNGLLVGLLSGCMFYVGTYTILPGGLAMLKNLMTNVKIIFKSK
jgi:O-antigen/teichoic acid export membrane protein